VKRAVVLVVVLVFALPPLLSAYWTDVMTAVAIYSVVALGLGLLMGRVGLVSLGQIAVLGLGAWVAAKLAFATGLPFPLILLGAGLVTMVLGTLVGLPALRLSGLYLALITLMLAGAITVVLTATNFPNGGPGFLSHTESSFGNPAVRRPALAASDEAYFPYVVVVAALMFALPRRPVCARWRAGMCVRGRAARGPRSARASRRRSPRASTSRSTSCGRGRWRRS